MPQLTPGKFVIILVALFAVGTVGVLWLSTYQLPAGTLTATDRRMINLARTRYYSPDMIVKRCWRDIYRVEPRNEKDPPLLFLDLAGNRVDSGNSTWQALWYELRPCTANLIPLTH